MSDAQSLIRLDKIKWWVTIANGNRVVVPICPKHDLRMESTYEAGNKLFCPEGDSYKFPRNIASEKRYVLAKIDAKIFRNMKVVNLDDEAVPLAKDEISGGNNPYWVKANLVESKMGLRLIVYAGSREKQNKAQLFIEPAHGRLGFDQNDTHPLEVFTKVEATFAGSKAAMEKPSEHQAKKPNKKGKK